jgi:hypothetical protein
MDKFYGDVIEVSGKCWEFIGLDDSTPQFTSGDISQSFESCNDCIWPEQFDISLNADTPGDTLGTDAHESFTVTRDAVATAGDVSWTYTDDPFPTFACGGSNCAQLFYRLSVVVLGGGMYAWTSTTFTRQCWYAMSAITIPTAGDDPTGDYAITVVDGTGGGGTGPCTTPVVDNVATGQIGTITISNV